MKCLISAFKKDETLLNNYRHDMLAAALKGQGYNVWECLGSSKEYGKERVLMIEADDFFEHTEKDFFGCMCIAFGQDHWLYVMDDGTAYTYTPEHEAYRIGVLRAVPAGGGTDLAYLVNAINDGSYTHDVSRNVWYTIETDDMARAAANVENKPAAAPARFTYGTPAYMEAQSSQARTYPY